MESEHTLHKQASHHRHTHPLSSHDAMALAAGAGDEHPSSEHRHGHGGSAMLYCHDMAMSFHGGADELVLFKFWQINSTVSLIISCVCIFVVAVLYEGLKSYREWLCRRKMRQEGGAEEVTDTVRRLSFLVTPHDHQHHHMRHPSPGRFEMTPDEQPRKWFSSMHIYQTILHMVQVTISFLLMLIFMTFNVWLCLAVVLGAGLGYFIFTRDCGHSSSEHCN